MPTRHERSAHNAHQPHDLYEVRDSKGTIVRYSVVVIKDGKPKVPMKKAPNEQFTLIQHFDNQAEAVKKRTEYERAVLLKIDTSAGDGSKLPAFYPSMGRDPHVRRHMFLEMEPQEQEEFLYEILVSTGRPMKRVLQWLMVQPEEVEHVSTEFIEAAQAELDLRIAKKMVGHALKNESPNAQTATMFLSKAKLGWNEQGEIQAIDEVKGRSGGLFEGMQVVETDRDPKTGETRGESKVLPMVRKG